MNETIAIPVLRRSSNLDSPPPRIQLVPPKPEKLAYVQRLGVSLTVLPHRLHRRLRFPFPSPRSRSGTRAGDTRVL